MAVGIAMILAGIGLVWRANRSRATIAGLSKPPIVCVFEQLHEAATGDAAAVGQAISAECDDAITPEQFAQWVDNVRAFQALFEELHRVADGANPWFRSDEELAQMAESNPDLMAQIHSTVARGGPIHGIDTTGMPPILGCSDVTHCTRLLSAHALHLCRRGQSERAIDDLVAMIRLGHAAAMEPSGGGAADAL
ncbi:MAG: hypothetical protein JXR94_15700, partial [Candidatus Hydrogenedentes bacterium]|nr:hypothetical protein [Candidatus Hydrogenedentota bacterium]